MGRGVPRQARLAGSLARPFSRPALEKPGAAAVKDGLDHSEDRTLDRGGDQDFFHGVVGGQSMGGLVPVPRGGVLPYQFEYLPGDGDADQA